MVVCLNKPRCKRFIFVNKEVGTRCKRAPEGEMIFECFKDAEVLNTFKKLKIEEQNEIIQNINSTATENQKVERILKFIAKLEHLS